MKEEIENENEKENNNDDNNDNDNIKNENINFETDLLKYNFDYTTKFNSCNLNEKEKRKFILNLFLMSSKINFFNKFICLNKLHDISSEEQNFSMIYNITYKIINNLKKQIIPTLYINMSSLFTYEFLSDSQNYFYAFKSLNDIKKLTMKETIDNFLYKEIQDFIILKIETYKTIFKNMLKVGNINSIISTINKILNENKEKDNNNNKNKNDNKNTDINNYINEFDSKKVLKENDENNININNINDYNINNINDNNINNINNKNDNKITNMENKKTEKNEIIDINEINEIENNENENKVKEKEKNEIISNDFIEETEENQKIKSQYLYAINKIWLENAKKFIENYLFAKETNLLKDFFNDSFDPDYALAAFLLNGRISKLPKGYTYYPFPGPINNFPLTTFKDQLIDPINIEENDLIEKDLIIGKDYYLIEYDDWKVLQNAFGFTNILIRSKDIIDMYQIGIVIFDQRLKKYKNDNINLFKKKIIQIGKDAYIYEFIEKINRAIEYEIENIKLKKNNNKNNKNNNKENKNKDKNNLINNNIDEIDNKINIMNINDDNEISNINKNNITQGGSSEEKKAVFYKVNKNNRDIIIEMYICFINDILIYESIFINEIKIDKEKKIKEIFNNYNPKTELLIIEILDTETSPKFLKQIKPIPNSKNIFTCSICDKKITDLNDTKYTCELCSMYLFCSKECGKNTKLKNGIEHHKLHNYFSELIFDKFNLSQFFSKKFYPKIYTKENMKKNKGVIGLLNLGNTCYMNCSLQCLSNTKDLTKYFLFNYFQNEINLLNTYGTNGVLLQGYSDLIFKMWLTDLKKLKPSFFRNSFCASTKKFMNNYQQDAMEFISILLNYLHEDLNRVSNKPYVQIEEQKENESDTNASKRYWDYHILRENSIIVDLFHGQFKNIIKCEYCHKEKKTYEPFINISLPIPEQHNHYIIKFFTHLKCKYITMNINYNTTFGDLIKKGTKYLSKDILDAWNNMENKKENEKYFQRLLESNIELVKLDKDKIINKIYSQPEKEKDIIENNKKKLLNYISSGEEIVLFERQIFPDYCQNIYVYPIMTDENDINKIHFLSYPVVFSVKHNLTLEKLEKLIFEQFKYIIIDNKINNNNKNYLIDLNILHSSKNVNTGFFKIIKEYQQCPFCQESYDTKRYCPLFFSFNKSDTIGKMFQFSKYTEPFVLLARSNYYDKNKNVYKDFNFEENNLINKHKNIYDSFNIFGTYESLGENNLWLCPQCNERRVIYKAIRIFKPPNYLILQLKRFKKKSENFFSFLEGDKNETFVSFPTKNLDLTNYIDGPEKINAIYNLYAVINHKSTLGFNHFTAFCRNNNKWIEYDDSKLYSVNNPITNEAYILFYIKKEIDE